MKCAVIVAGGNSTRFGNDKLNSMLFEKTVLQNTVDLFRPIVEQIVVVGVQVDGTTYAPAGQTRFLSVQNGLKMVDKNCDLVAIHDGARPFVSKNLIEKLFDQAKLKGSAIPSLPVTDTVWNLAEGAKVVNRNHLKSVQTPQVFRFDLICHAFANATHQNYTDESTLFYDVFDELNLVEGERANVKITYPGDLPTYRIGNGFDVHAFCDGNGVILGGVTISYNKKLKGHSDADVLAHAICDGVLSASNNRDIGVQFPDTDDKYLGANSMDLLAKCVQIAKDSGFEVVNVSAVVICQAPKLAPHIPQMAQNLAKVLGIDVSCVNLSATTTEKLGALGNGDGIAVQSTVLLKGI
jgi:2-C-methyl-D-erythritol 4-phosphate cytidylyltransferase/2-C-methyl-D-erythritol 2,4-cyclodiphosphate synthase